MLLSLNDDCLLNVCEFLNYFDQSSLAYSCQRLQQIVEECWRHESKKVVLDRDQCKYFAEKDPKFFKHFMKCISLNVENLEFDCIECKLFHVLQNLQFPKVTSLAIDFENENENDDENTKLIAKLFPNTKRLSIISNMTGKYLWNLTNLIDLDLGGCEFLDTKYFKEIFSTLHLKKLIIMFYGYNTCFDEMASDICECLTLEELHIDDHHLMILIDQLPRLKRLQKLVTYTRDYDTYLLEKIIKQSGETIDSIIFDDVFWSKDEHCENVGNMHNLRRLILHDDDIENNQLKLIGQKLGKTLQEFRFLKGRNTLKIVDGFIKLITYCTNLNVLDISNSEVNVGFLRTVIESIGSSLKNRRNPLTIRCFNTKITEEDAEILTIPNVIEITLENEKIRFPGTRCFQIEWVSKSD